MDGILQTLANSTKYQKSSQREPDGGSQNSHSPTKNLLLKNSDGIHKLPMRHYKLSHTDCCQSTSEKISVLIKVAKTLQPYIPKSSEARVDPVGQSKELSVPELTQRREEEMVDTEQTKFNLDSE